MGYSLFEFADFSPERYNMKMRCYYSDAPFADICSTRRGWYYL
jgi:hypothetical protein